LFRRCGRAARRLSGCPHHHPGDAQRTTGTRVMLRSALLYLSAQPRVFRFVRKNRLAKKFASRFVAGETLADAFDAMRLLNVRGISASLDLLGESVTNEREAHAARGQYLDML